MLRFLHLSCAEIVDWCGCLIDRRLLLSIRRVGRRTQITNVCLAVVRVIGRRANDDWCTWHWRCNFGLFVFLFFICLFFHLVLLFSGRGTPPSPTNHAGNAPLGQEVYDISSSARQHGSSMQNLVIIHIIRIVRLRRKGEIRGSGGHVLG